MANICLPNAAVCDAAAGVVVNPNYQPGCVRDNRQDFLGENGKQY